MIQDLRRKYYQALDDRAKVTTFHDIDGKGMSEDILAMTAELYAAAKVEKEFDGDLFSSAYHSPITGDLEFFIARILFHFAQNQGLDWTIHVRRQTKSTAPDIRIDKYGLTVGIIEIKAKGGWIQGFFSPEQFDRDQAKFIAKERDFDPDESNRRSKDQLAKYGKAFDLELENVFLLLPTLALIHRKTSLLKLEDYREHFAGSSGIPKENLVLLSSSLELDLSYRLGEFDPTGEFERMLKKLVARSESLPVVPPTVSAEKAPLEEPTVKKKVRANSKAFVASKYSQLYNLPRRTSRMWERSESPYYWDNWWFNFYLSDLENAEAIVLAGARDYINQEFSLMKVPSAFILDNVSKLDVNADGWVNLYIGMSDYVDQRKKEGLCFREFLIT